ncbi:hypothetical protein HZF05_03630 [Sphingomonas sp. CGMCC 1.13654]|uniref:DUF4350 domain-containing protein n=1 Tax=Sphingomonas chungangi TaxID=2683589 RepID=A0A838L1E6_9SPHN|nr:hypothetical protein [Sphingomonas chungangi]MBA2933181.1 hypothetical protein [Sphingomonas chungangi]MVW57853.1 hypothetical protein [Sphingomonas chungangi]
MSGEAQAAPFRSRTVIIIIVVAAIAFAGFLLLIAFAPQFQSGHDGRGHALSTSGNGYAGLVELTDDLGSHSLIVRDDAQLGTRDLLVVTPEIDTEQKDFTKLLASRGDAPTLVILPKWWTRPMPERPDWAQRVDMMWSGGPVFALSKYAPKMTIDQTPFKARPPRTGDTPRLARVKVGPLNEQQRLTGGGFTPVLLDKDGRVLIGKLVGRPVFVLADPDLLNNQGIADPWTARQGWQVIDDLAPTNEIAFDLTLNGFGTSKQEKSPLQSVFKPPFLPMTLIIVAAGLLAGLHGAVRFGAPAVTARAIAMGKRTLVDNAAMLFRAARKEHRVGAAYAALTRDLTAQATHAPARLSGEALDDYLNRSGKAEGDPPYATLAWQAETAEDRDQLLSAARALYRWRRNRTR